MVTIDTDLSIKIKEAMLRYDALEASLSILKHSNIVMQESVEVGKDCKAHTQAIVELSNQKASAKEEYYKLIDKVLQQVPEITNVASLGDGWYGVKYIQSDKQLSMKIVPMEEKKIDWIHRNKRTGHHDITSMEIDNLLVVVADEDSMEMYHNEVNRATKMVLSTYGVVLEADKLLVEASQHALKRWVRRKMNMLNAQESAILEVLQSNEEGIRDAVLSGYDASEKIWEDEYGYQYMLDAENTIYIVRDNVIITVYEDDFGFDKNVNAMIIREQLKVVEQARKKYEVVKGWNTEKIKELEGEISECINQIDIMKQKVAEMKESKIIATKEMNEFYNVYREQSNKLFRRGM